MIPTVLTIKCYQCRSSETIECSDVMINLPDSPLKPESCDHVFEAEYCIKSTSLESKNANNFGRLVFLFGFFRGNWSNLILLVVLVGPIEYAN